jgi:hypothetical protein
MTKISNQYSLTNVLTADTTNGRVGINNGSPAYALDVTGTARVSGNATFSSSVGIGTASPSATLHTVGTVRINSTSVSNQYMELYTTGGISYYNSQNNSAFYTAFQHIFNTDGTSATERMRITSDGLVGIGTSSPTRSLQITRTSTAFINVEGSSMAFGSSNAPLLFYANNNESMRITSGGNVGINTTSPSGKLEVVGNNSSGVGNLYIANSSGLNMLYVSAPTFTVGINASNGGTSENVRFYNAGTAVGTITTTGSTTSYNMTSDYRLKEDLKEIKGLDKVSAIKVYDYKWKSDSTRMDGVLAHELQEVLPYAVYGEKDGEEMQSVDYSKIVPVLVAAIQELSADLTSAKQEIELLKAK